MTIVHVETGRRFYGGALQVLYLMRGLIRRGVPSLLLAPKGSQIAAEARAWKLPTEDFPFRGEADFTAVWRMKRRFLNAGAILVHVHSRRGGDAFGGFAAGRAKVPTVLTRRVDNSELAWVARRKYAAYDHVVAISEAVRSVLADNGVPSEKTSLVPSAVDVSEWQSPRTRSSLNREFDLVPGAPAAAMVAQFIPRKGHRELVEALTFLRWRTKRDARDRARGRRTAADRRRSSKPSRAVGRRRAAEQNGNDPQALVQRRLPTVVLFGQGPLRNTVAGFAERAGVSDLLRFAGYRNDLPKWLGAFDFLVHPATAEGLGVAVLQASAAGLPVVASKAGGLPEVVEDGETGFLFKSGDVGELAGNLSAMSSAQARVPTREMGRRGRRRVQKLFSVDSMVNGYLDVYRSVLGPEWRGPNADRSRPRLALVP